MIETTGQSNLGSSDEIAFAGNGTLMRGLELNRNLLEIGGRFIKEARTAPAYRMWSIAGEHPAMMRDDDGGSTISLELWTVPSAGIAALLQKEPPGLCVGRIELEDGTKVLGVLGEPHLIEGRQEITRWGGRRQYTESLRG